MKITKQQFEDYWRNKGRFLRVKNPERFFQNLADKIEEYGDTVFLDEYVIELRKGREITRKVVLDFYHYLEDNSSAGKPESSLYDIRFYDYPFERQLEIAKFLHTEKTTSEIQEHFNIDARTVRSDLQELEEGITIMDRINGIETKAKIRDRITAIKDKGQILFNSVCNSNFAGNLLLVDSLMDEIISHMLIEYYNNGHYYCSDIATALEAKDPLGFKREGVYRYKIKKFLSAIALGMMPSKKWDGQDEANGGYIIVKGLGEVVTYHLYNRNSFENYLLNNTKLETASTSRNKFGVIYKNEKGDMFINLNLQVRFV